MANENDALLQAYATLEALRKHVPEHYVPEEFGREYESKVKEDGELIGRDLSRFLLPSDYYHREVTSSRSDYAGNIIDRKYSDTVTVKRDLFLAKFDGLLNYLRLLMPEGTARKIGF